MRTRGAALQEVGWVKEALRRTPGMERCFGLVGACCRACAEAAGPSLLFGPSELHGGACLLPWLRFFAVLASVSAFADDYASQLPRIAATPPSEATGTLVVADGFRAELIASEPLISSPVAIDWDASGRLYVCEMRGYSELRDEAISRITVLDDDNDDGVFDRSEVFIDKLKWPTGVFAYGGGLFVGDAPDLLFFRDTDGDGRADERTVVLTGFAHSNVQGLMNSFRWGLDNRIHIATGTVGGRVRKPDQDASEAIEVRGRDVAFDPRTGEFQLTSGGGQHGMCFDDWGRKYVSSNSDHIQQVVFDSERLKGSGSFRVPPTRVSIAADGPQAEVFRASPVEPWRILRTRLRVSGAVGGPVEGGGRAAGYFTGATGVTVYRGDQWNQAHHGTAIVGDVGSNLIHRKQIIGNGVQRKAQRIDTTSEFVASTDTWFRPAQFACGPDGNLTVVDVYREVIEHPKSLPPAIKQHLDLNAGSDRGRLYRIVASDHVHRPNLDFRQLTSLELVEQLGHANAWHREKASQLLYERQDLAVVPRLRAMVSQSPRPLARLHAIYVLSGLAERTIDGVKVMGNELDVESLLAGLSDLNANVRRHAIRLAERKVESSRPGQLRDAAWVKVRERLVSMATDESSEVRLELALAWKTFQSDSGDGLLSEIIQYGINEKWIRVAVLSSLGKQCDSMFAGLLKDGAFRSKEAGEFLASVAEQIQRNGSAESIRLARESLLVAPEADPLFVLPILGALRAGSSADSEALRLQRRRLIRQCMDIAGDQKLTTSKRVRAVSLLRHGDFLMVKSSLKTLVESHGEPTIQSAAVSSLGTFQDDAVASMILPVWRAMPPTARRGAIEVLFARPSRVSQLLDAFDAGEVSPVEVPRDRLSRLLKSSDAKLRDRATVLLEALSGTKRSDVVRQYQESLKSQGDEASGRALFRKHCANCHRVENFGHEVGPNLIAIKSRGAEAILTNVLDPNREVNPQFLNYSVVTVDGRTLTGMIVSESSASVMLKRGDAVTETVSRDEIEELQTSGLSLMPEGFETAIPIAEMSDLIAYLMTVGTRQ